MLLRTRFLEESNHRDEGEGHVPRAGGEAWDSGLMETVSPWEEEKVLQAMGARAVEGWEGSQGH